MAKAIPTWDIYDPSRGDPVKASCDAFTPDLFRLRPCERDWAQEERIQSRELIISGCLGVIAIASGALAGPPSSQCIRTTSMHVHYSAFGRSADIRRNTVDFSPSLCRSFTGGLEESCSSDRSWFGLLLTCKHGCGSISCHYAAVLIKTSCRRNTVSKKAWMDINNYSIQILGCTHLAVRLSSFPVLIAPIASIHESSRASDRANCSWKCDDKQYE